MAAWDVEPTLSDDDLDSMLAGAALQDAAGRGPSDGGWTPTYDLNSAASRLWLVKAARASILIEGEPPGVVTSKVFDNCRAMARIYAAKRNSSVVV